MYVAGVNEYEYAYLGQWVNKFPIDNKHVTNRMKCFCF